MEIQGISFKSSLLTNKISQSNIGISPAVASPAADTVELSNKNKGNRTLKYTLIGIGALLGVFVIAKHKSIAKLFKKASVAETATKSSSTEATKANGLTPPTTSVKNIENIATNTPSPLVPLEKIVNSNGEPFIQDSSEGYQLWHFVSPEFLEKFISSHPDLSELFEKTGLGKYRLYDLKFIKEEALEGKTEVITFVKAVKEKAKIDLCGEFKHYRFIGQSEFNVIKSGKGIEKGRYIALSPNGGAGFDIAPKLTDYRITFKNTDNLVNHLAPYHDTAYKTWTNTPYSYADIEKVEKLVDGKWQEVEFAPDNKISKPIISKSTKPKKVVTHKPEEGALIKSEKGARAVSVAKLSEIEVRSLIEKHLGPNRQYNLSSVDRAKIEKQYGDYSQEYIKNLCLPVDEEGIQFMTQIANICDGKYAEFWKNNPDKLILMANGGTLKSKIDKNWDEATWDTVFGSFKAFFENKVGDESLDAVMKYKQCFFEALNCKLTSRGEIDGILKSLNGKKVINSVESGQIKLTLEYLKKLTGDQMPGVTDDLVPQFDRAFDDIIKHLNASEVSHADVEQVKTKLSKLLRNILDYRKEHDDQKIIDRLVELIEKHGSDMERVKLSRVERSLNGCALSVLNFDGRPLSDLMKEAMDKKDSLLIGRICNHLNSSQPVVNRSSFTSTSVPPFQSFSSPSPVHWTLTSSKEVKGLYVEDLYNIFLHKVHKFGREAEVILQKGIKVQIKKAEFKNNVWELEGFLSAGEKV